MSQNDVRTILLSYRRHPELVDDEHLFSGSLELYTPSGSRLELLPFEQLSFNKMLSRVSEHLRQNPDAQVVLTRLEQTALRPIQLGEETRVLLRDDPVTAIRTMNVQAGQAPPTDQHRPVLRSAYDTLAEAFGLHLYVRMHTGYIEDPLTGKTASLAFGHKSGWRIRGEGDSWTNWLPISLPELEGQTVAFSADDDKAAQELAGQLARCKWAVISIFDLLERPGNKFFLPRLWNSHGQWITRQALNERLDKYNQEKAQAS